MDTGRIRESWIVAASQLLFPYDRTGSHQTVAALLSRCRRIRDE